MILMIDNYDSFTYNVVQYLKMLGERVYTVRNDEVDYSLIESIKPKCIFISPGPKSPTEAGQCIDIIHKYKGIIPIFGVCLGHQCIGQAFGAKIGKARMLMHGKNSDIISLHKGVFKELPIEKFSVTRYHSLVIEKENLPECLEVTCMTEDGEIMGIKHKEYNIEGVQFHPEAVLSEHGLNILKLFLAKCASRGENNETEVDNTSFKKSDFKETNTYKISFKQALSHYTLNSDFYSLFLNIYCQSEKYKKCIFFDSAGGPRKDLNISVIGINPLFSILLKDGKLQITSEQKRYKQEIETLLSHYFEKENDEFLTGETKFSKIFEILRHSLIIKKKHSSEKLPLSCPLMGYFSYEYLHYLENVPEVGCDKLQMPDVELSFYSTLLVHEYDKNEVYLVSNQFSDENTNIQDILDTIQNAEVKRKYPVQNEFSGDNSIQHIESLKNQTRERYIEIVKRNKEYITNGDIFQVQISMRESMKMQAEPIVLYDELRKLNPSPYMCFFNNGKFSVVSNSPELQFSICNKKAMIRPIAGTSPGKGHDEMSKANIYKQFEEDVKEHAEHLMLVDLARNDLGRMATTGTVKVEDLMNIEEYANVFHLTSTVTCQLQKNLNPFELFEATFPAGTLTGAPKIRAMEIISEFEPETRGLYGGAIGLFDLDSGNIMSSIIIRTILKIGNEIYLQAAAGTVADSQPEKEWEEINFKLSTIKKSILNVSQLKKQQL